MRRLPSKRFFLTTAAIVALVVVAGAAVAAGQDSSSGYRTATASSRSVEQTLDEVGTIAPTSQATVGFPIAGTVSTVDVALGATVTAGQVLATLDTASLEADVRTAQAALDRAELTLEQAEEGETVTGGGGGAATIAASTSDGDVTFQLVAATGPDDALTVARQAVLQAKQQVDAHLLAAHEALDSATAICAAADASACSDALDAALAAQQTLADSQQALNDAATAFDELLAQRAADTPSPDPSTPPTTDPSTPPTGDPSTPPTTTSTPPTSSPPQGGDTPSNGSAPATNSPSSEDLIAYQAAIDAAEIDVTVAEEALQQARIVAPIDGTVVTLDLAAGQEVRAASDTDVVVVAGTGATR